MLPSPLPPSTFHKHDICDYKQKCSVHTSARKSRFSWPHHTICAIPVSLILLMLPPSIDYPLHTPCLKLTLHCLCLATILFCRDLKPENLLYMSNDESAPKYNQIKVADFGLARCKVPGVPMQTMCGTPGDQLLLIFNDHIDICLLCTPFGPVSKQDAQSPEACSAWNIRP